MKNILRGIIKNIFRVYYKIVYRYKVEGKENIPKDGPAIFCGNHKSFLDAPIITITSGKPIRFLSKDELRKHVSLRILLNLFDVIWVKRDKNDVTSVKQSLKVLKDNQFLGIFPEGTRNGLEKGIEIKDGAAFFALRSGAKVVPCGIKGGVKGNRKVTITYGETLDFSEYKGSRDKDILDKVTNEIMDNIIKISS